MIHPQYAAGLFDGEGSIGIYRYRGSADIRYRSGKRPAGWIRSVMIHACFKPTLEEFASRYGGRVVLNRGEGRNKALWTWSLGSSVAIKQFLLSVLPHLREKKAQAEMMLRALDGRISMLDASVLLKGMKKETF